jgi:hypothetical protein
MSSYIKKILSVCAKLKKLNIEKLTKEYGGKFNPKFGFYISAVLELVLFVHDCWDAIIKFLAGKLNTKEYLEVVTKRIWAAGLSLGGFQLGYLLGGVAPLAFLGWWPLSVLGAIVVGAGVDYLAKLLGGFLGQIITPLVVSIAKEFLQSVKSTMSMVGLQKDLNVEKFSSSLESIINDLESETKKDV